MEEKHKGKKAEVMGWIIGTILMMWLLAFANVSMSEPSLTPVNGAIIGTWMATLFGRFIYAAWKEFDY